MNELTAFLQVLIPPVLAVAALVILVRGRASSESLVINQMLKRIDDLETKMTLSLAWAMQLSQQVVELGGKPIRFEDVERMQNAAVSSIKSDPSKLLGVLSTLFSIDELESLAFELGAKEGSLGNGEIDARALRLIRYAKSRNKVDVLAHLVWRQRPDAYIGDAT